MITLKNCPELWNLLTHHPPVILASSEILLFSYHSAWHYISDDCNLYWSLILEWHGWQLEKILYYVYSVWEYKGCWKAILSLQIINLTVLQQCIWTVTVKTVIFLIKDSSELEWKLCCLNIIVYWYSVHFIIIFFK